MRGRPWALQVSAPPQDIAIRYEVRDVCDDHQLLLVYLDVKSS